MTPRRLLRLYPRQWRQRYGDEFLALLEARPVSRTVVVDIIRAAAWEWIRWTRTGRLALAAGIAVPLAWLEGRLIQRWPAPIGAFWDFRPPTWTHFWMEMAVLSSPWLLGLVLLILARPPAAGGRRIAFPVQVLVLIFGAIAEQWLLVIPVRDPDLSKTLLSHWSGSTLYIALFLTWLFNIEGGATQRYLRRRGSEWGDR
jgi:hypothetical protein